MSYKKIFLILLAVLFINNISVSSLDAKEKDTKTIYKSMKDIPKPLMKFTPNQLKDLYVSRIISETTRGSENKTVIKIKNIIKKNTLKLKKEQQKQVTAFLAMYDKNIDGIITNDEIAFLEKEIKTNAHKHHNKNIKKRHEKEKKHLKNST